MRPDASAPPRNSSSAKCAGARACRGNIRGNMPIISRASPNMLRRAVAINQMAAHAERRAPVRSNNRNVRQRRHQACLRARRELANREWRPSAPRENSLFCNEMKFAHLLSNGGARNIEISPIVKGLFSKPLTLLRPAVQRLKRKSSAKLPQYISAWRHFGGAYGSCSGWRV